MSRRFQVIRLLVVVALMTGLIFTLEPYDVRLKWNMVIENLRGDLKRFLDFSEAFGHGFGATLSVLLIWALAPERRRQVPRLIGTLALVSLITEGLKRIFDRVRPGAFWGWGPDQINTWQSVEELKTLRPDPQLDWDYLAVSFPSGHSASAVALAVALSYLFPRGKPIYWILAGGTCLQRIYANAHWPTDVLAGATIGFVVAELVYLIPLTRWEQKH